MSSPKGRKRLWSDNPTSPAQSLKDSANPTRLSQRPSQSPQLSQLPAQSTPESTHDGEGTGSATGSKAKRAKRAKYVGVACQECKRRKIKCNGESPCERCKNFELECIYTGSNICCQNNFRQSAEFKEITEQMTALQASIAQLTQVIQSTPVRSNTTRSAEDESDGTESIRPTERGKSSGYNGLTSAAFSFGVAQKSLNDLGITPGTSQSTSPCPSGSAGETGDPSRPSSKDLLLSLSMEQVGELFTIYHDEVHVVYPLFDFKAFVERIMPLWEGKANLEDFSTQQLNQARIILAVAVAGEKGEQKIGKRLYARAKRDFDFESKPSPEGLVTLVLLSVYQFTIDKESLAYRTIGIAARFCFELGLHRSGELLRLFKNPWERSWGVNLFWCIYVLDRRWSFGTGRPYAMRDADIDRNMPSVEVTSETGYPALNLANLVSYSRVAARVWDALSVIKEGDNTANVDIRYLDLLVLEWQRELPEELRYKSQSDPSHPKYLKKLQVLSYIRANQMRLQIHKPILFSAESIAANMSGAHLAVEVAKDTIRVLSHLHKTSDLYSKSQLHYNHFLLSALSMLFAAVAHAPAIFSNICREEYYMALNLVKLMSKKSNYARGLWKALRGLKKIGPRLGLRAPEYGKNPTIERSIAPENEVELNASVRPEISSLISNINDQTASQLSPPPPPLPPPHPPPPPTTESDTESAFDGYQISAEMTQWFVDATANVTLDPGNQMFLGGVPCSNMGDFVSGNNSAGGNQYLPVTGEGDSAALGFMRSFLF